MVRASQLKHYYFRNTAFSYNTNDTPLNGPHWESGSSNCLTSVKQYVERAPGWAAVEATPTVFTGDIVRQFTWEQWDGTFYILVCEKYTGHSKVWKMQIGTDASFVALYDDTTAGADIWDFAVSNNTLYFMNGTQAWAWNGKAASVRPWGIGTSPMIGVSGDLAKGRPTTSTGGTGITATVGYQYVYTYGNSTTNHQSSASNPSASTGAFSNKTVTVTLQRSSDTQVDKVHVYRTTDGGGGIYFEISGSPFAHTPGTGTMTATDTTPDSSLSSFKAPVGPDLSNTTSPTPQGLNNPPIIGLGPIWYANRIWWFKNNTVYYSAWEEIIDLGLQEECVPPGNQILFNQNVTGIASNDDFLIIFTATAVWKIAGDSLATFSRAPLFKKVGCRNRACIATYGKSIAWFDSSHTVRITDGFQHKELSQDIRPDLAAISFDTASLSFFSQGTMHWLCLLDGTGGIMYVYDLDLEQWMPPWKHVGASKSIYWGEISAGNPALLLGSASKKVLNITPSAYLFDGSSYTAEARSYLMEMVPPDQPNRIANAQVITLERNAIGLSDVLELRDEDTNTGTYTSDAANISTIQDGANYISPPLRPQGTNLIDEWYSTQEIGCKRMSVKFMWSAANSNFKLYSYSVGFYELD